MLDFLQLRLNSHGHIIGTEYLSDLVEKEHAANKHGIVLGVVHLHHGFNLIYLFGSFIHVHNIWLCFLDIVICIKEATSFATCCWCLIVNALPFLFFLSFWGWVGGDKWRDKTIKCTKRSDSYDFCSFLEITNGQFSSSRCFHAKRDTLVVGLSSPNYCTRNSPSLEYFFLIKYI